MVWPTQVLETWWCKWDNVTQTFQDCPADDAPTVSGMIVLFEKLLSLPLELSTPAQRDAWAAFSTILPTLPVAASEQSASIPVIAPGRNLPAKTHNSEGPALYATHPHRQYTMGRHVASAQNISLANDTFTYGVWGWVNNEG